MIDSTTDPDFAAYERQESLKETHPPVAEGAGGVSASKICRGRLSALPMPSSAAPSAAEATTTVSVSPSPAPTTPLVHLRMARIGGVAAFALALFLLWIRQQRKS